MKIIVYVVDCLRADHVTCYGYERPTTPHIDRLAADGVRFQNAFSPSTWTKPVAASLLTGVYPLVHGVRMRGDVLRRDLVTLPEILGWYGHETLAISAIGNVSSTLGYDKGFDRFIDLYKEPSLRSKRQIADVNKEKLYSERPGEVVFPLAEDVNQFLFPWLAEHVETDFFAFLWTMDPHDPYTPPPDWRVFVDESYAGSMDGSREKARHASRPDDLRHLIDLYDSEIVYTDHCLGQLVAYLKRLGIYDETAIVVLGDHGEAFGDHGHVLHGHLPYDEIIRVPLIIKLPGGEHRGRAVEEQVGLVDLMPTLLDVAAVPYGEWEAVGQGESLLRALEGGERAQQMLFSETQATETNNIVYSLRSTRWKFIWVRPPANRHGLERVWRLVTSPGILKDLLKNPRFYYRRQVGLLTYQLFDLLADADEACNVADDHPEEVARFVQEIERWHQACNELAETYQERVNVQGIDPVTLEQLRALGYIE